MKIIGLMSGTSLDGLDLALCDFQEDNDGVKFSVLASQTIEYDNEWKSRLKNIYTANAIEYFKLHSSYGAYVGKAIVDFLNKNQQVADYVASHGHTVFHQPEIGFTTQIGCGATIAAYTGITTICDFRSLDIALKGQGAPLVPIGDRDLFSKYEACLNIGGIANISFTRNSITHAQDICIANMALNYLTETIGEAFDNKGNIASRGRINNMLLNTLLELSTHSNSLGREWFDNSFLPILNEFHLSVEDKLATCVELISLNITQYLNNNHLTSVLITGGGAYNDFLINRFKKYYNGKIVIPSDEIIQFKEAIIFAYLGYLRINNQINTLNSVTRAVKNSIGGCVYLVVPQII